MPDDSVPTGLPYSHLYIERPQPTGDSAKARARLGNYLDNIDTDFQRQIAELLRLELGISVSSHTLTEHIAECSLPQFLDSLTYIFQALPRTEPYTRRKPDREWAAFAERVLVEESLTYALDDDGGVHPAPDREFVVSKASTIGVLASARYETVRVLFEKGVSELRFPESNNSAIRHTFEACENLFKLMLNGSCARMGETEIEKSLKPQLKQLLVDADYNAAVQMISALKSWTTASHQFRHAQGTEAPSQASTDLAVLMVSTGAAYIRWLAHIDKKMMEAASSASR